MDKETLIALTADIVASHVANNNVAIGDVGTLVQRVHDALSGLGQSAEPAPQAREPAVSVRSSVKPDTITCLVCGRKQKTLKRHLASAHGLSPAQYREEFGLPASYPMTAANYSAQRSAMAKTIGLGHKKGEPGTRGGKPRAKRSRSAAGSEA
jgi:predicted transcriptional regulator